MQLKDITKEAIIISENASFGEALDLMLNQHTNTLLVSDEEGKLSGEVSVNDLFDGIVPMNMDGDEATALLKDESAFVKAVKAARETPVFDFMSSDFTAVRPDDSILEVAAIAVSHQRGRIPVVDHSDRPIGIISRQGLKQILGSYIGS